MRLGRYDIITRLARGGMAEIFLATAHGPEGFAKRAVVKRLLPHLAARPEIVSMFLEEARLAAGLHHPHIVQIYDLGEEGGDHFICMEYLAGKDLAAILGCARERGVALPLEIVAQIGSCVAQGLHFAHEHTNARGEPAEVIHGDISLSNIVVTFVGEVKIVDFGIARAAGAVQVAFPGAIRGKLGYLPPEQLRTGRSDRRADIYALGVVLHELLTGERLFRRDTEEQVLRAVLEEPVPDPRERRPEIPERLARLVMSALERDPDKRLPSADRFREELDAFLAERGWPPTSARLAEFLKDLFGAEQAREVLCGPAHEPTGSVTAAAAPPADPVPGFSVPAIPLLPVERGPGRKPLVRVAGDVPAALLKAGQNLVAVPANALASAMRWSRRKLIGLAVLFAVVGFGAGILAREVRDMTVDEPPEVSAQAASPAEEGQPDPKGLDPLAVAPEVKTPERPGDELDEGEPDAGDNPSPRAMPTHGRLELLGKGTVYVRGAALGRAPLRRSLPGGTYDVALVDDTGQVRGTWIAVIRPGHTTRLEP